MANRFMADAPAASKSKLVTDRLDRIDRFMSTGQGAAAAAQLQALANQVMGLSPRWISAPDARHMAAEADRLRSVLAP